MAAAATATFGGAVALAVVTIVEAMELRTEMAAMVGLEAGSSSAACSATTATEEAMVADDRAVERGNGNVGRVVAMEGGACLSSLASSHSESI